MSNLPGGSVKGSGMGVAALVLGIIAIVLPLVGILPGVIGIVLGIVALVQNGNRTRVGGKGMAIAGIVLGGVGILFTPIIALFIAILLPSLGRARELSNRAYCNANMRGITQSMLVYAADNGDRYPVVPYKEYGAGNSGTSGDTFVGNEGLAMHSMFESGSSTAGSPLSGMWILVLNKQVTPKQFVCKSDPFGSGVAEVDSGGSTYLNFQKDSQVSYSFQYPYDADGKVSRAWSNTSDASLPVAADMTPRDGTGNPRRDLGAVTVSSPKMRNSGNHQGEGQIVGYADGHAEFERVPLVGQIGDNIYTTRRGQPVKSAVNLPEEAPPFDTYLVPVRDLDSGKL